MKKQTKYGIWIVFLLVCISPNIHAQAAFSSTSNHTFLGGMEHSYVIGEMSLVHTASTSKLTVTQGTLQPTDQTLGVEDIIDWVKDIKVYPNPVKEVLYIDTYITIGSDFSYRLLDLNGKLLYSSKKKINADQQQHQLEMGLYQTGTYILDAEVMHQGKKAIQRFKVVKH